MARKAVAGPCLIRLGGPEASAERRGAGSEAEVTAEARRRDGDGSVGGCAAASGICGAVRAAQVSRGLSRCEEGRTRGSWYRGELEEKNGPLDQSTGALGLEKELGTGTWLGVVGRVPRLEPLDQSEALRGRACPGPYAQELVSHAAC
jgi:hypothetical protein